MNWWEVLGVDRNAELRSVKRAYAVLIKQYRPETHPQEFSEIRMAYEYARDCCQGDNTVDRKAVQYRAIEVRQENDTTNTNTEIEVEAEAEVEIEAEVDEPPPTDSQAEFSDFLQLLNAWTASGYGYGENLDLLLGHEVHNTWFGFQQAKTVVFERLLESVAIAQGILSTRLNIDSRLLAELDQLYRWSQEEIELHEHYDHENIALLFYGIEQGYKQLPIVNAIASRPSGNWRKFTFWGLVSVILVVTVTLSLIVWTQNQ